jgi:hypothetical protein
MAVNIIGIDNLKNHLAKFNFISKIELCERERSTRAILITSKVAPVDEVIKYFEDLHESAQTAQYYLKVFLKGPNTQSENGKDYVGFTFACIDSRGKTVNGPSQGSYQDMIQVYTETGFLRAENARLINKVADLEDELDELEDKLENGEGNKVSGVDEASKWIKAFSELKDLIPTITGIPGKQSLGPSADMELNNWIAELQMLDPYFKMRMKAYLDEVKNPQQNGEGNTGGNNGNNQGTNKT